MNNAALQMEKFKTVDKLLPPRGANIYNAGIKDNDKGFIKYGPKSTDQPNLMIVDPISDDDGNMIMPGYYELLLSKDRQTLLLSQQQKIVAIIPVFKVEEDKSKLQAIQPIDYKSQRKFNKEQKAQAKKNKKLIKDGEISEIPPIYNNASIQYDEKGDYYLIQYERGAIRAWGAIKQ